MYTTHNEPIRVENQIPGQSRVRSVCTNNSEIQIENSDNDSVNVLCNVIIVFTLILLAIFYLLRIPLEGRGDLELCSLVGVTLIKAHHTVMTLNICFTYTM